MPSIETIYRYNTWMKYIDAILAKGSQDKKRTSVAIVAQGIQTKKDIRSNVGARHPEKGHPYPFWLKAAR